MSRLLDDPILSDATDARALSGLSGARVVLMTRDGRHWFVRKAARDGAGNARLQRQLAKQLEFGGAVDGAVRVPEILGQGEIDGRFYFDMAFVRGTDGVNYIRRATYPEVVVVADRLCAYLREVATRTTATPASAASMFDALYAKLCDVEKRTRVLDSTTLARLFLALHRLRGLAAASTMCHGDLTLENFVVDDRGVFWLLDFLDAPFEHWWQDVAKLHQDLDGGWYLLAQAPIARCVIDYVSGRVMTAATELDPRYPAIHAVMVACTFARILPYARTAEELEFVKTRVEHFARIASEEAT